MALFKMMINNPYKPRAPFLWGTGNQCRSDTASDQNLHCLLTGCFIKIWRKKIQPKSTKIGNGLVLLIRVGKSIQILSVNLPYILFVCFSALCLSQQFFSHVGTISCLPGLNKLLLK